MQEMLETHIRFLGQEDALGEEMATHSSILCLDNSMDRGAWQGYSPWGRKELDTTEHTQTHSPS